MARRLPADARQTLGTFFAHILFNVMTGMTKAKSVEAETGKLRAKLRELTEERMRQVADLAGEYYAERANPSPNKMSPEQVAILKTEAIEYALDKLENETESD